MKELFNLQENKDGTVAVSGRELHRGLEVKEKYTDWIKRMIAYGFEENTDYILVSEKRVTNNPRNPYTNQTDHVITLDAAKEIAMIQRTEKGKQIRKYFIEVEKKYKKELESKQDSYMIENPIKRAERWIEEQEERMMLEQEVGELKPKADYVDEILNSEGTLTITQIAADYGISAQKLNKILHEERLQRKVNKQWLLYSEHMNKSYTESDTIPITRSDGREEIVLQTKWTQKGRLKIHDIMSSRGYEGKVESN